MMRLRSSNSALSRATLWEISWRNWPITSAAARGASEAVSIRRVMGSSSAVPSVVKWPVSAVCSSASRSTAALPRRASSLRSAPSSVCSTRALLCVLSVMCCAVWVSVLQISCCCARVCALVCCHALCKLAAMFSSAVRQACRRWLSPLACSACTLALASFTDNSSAVAPV